MKKFVLVLAAIFGFLIVGCPEGNGVLGAAGISLNNVSSSAVTEFYVIPADCDTWGDNWLAAPLETNSEAKFFGLSGGYYNIMVADEDGNFVVWRKVFLSEGELTVLCWYGNYY